MTSPLPSPWVAGTGWAQRRLRQPGWQLIPLRGFLGVTFTYAGLQKLANPKYLDPHSPTSVAAQMTALRHSSPIGPLLGLSLHAPTLVGLLIAFGELAVGIGTLLGLWTRLAAVGGMALALSFFLTVSWSTSPYYFGSDIVFFFAWSALAAMGSGGVLSLDGWLHDRARIEAGRTRTPASFAVDADRLRTLCPRTSGCGLRPTGGCRETHRCPLTDTLMGATAPDADLDRRRVLLGARAVGVVGVLSLATAGITALLGRLAGGTSTATASRKPANNTGTAPATAPSTSPSARHQHRQQPAPGTAIGSAANLPVGQAGRFTDPKSGAPAWVVHPSASTFAAFSAVCTHAGCTVEFDSGSMEFVCPCHGGRYDARTGRVVAGPPPAPLASIAVHVVNGRIRVD